MTASPRINKHDSPIGPVRSRFAEVASPDRPLRLENGKSIARASLAYEVYGDLQPDAENVVLLFHALSGSQHAAGLNTGVPGLDGRWTDECVVGWWDEFIGPGKALDTDRLAVVCVNYLGGCYGSTGPASTNPETGLPYGPTFPQVSFSDIVNSQIRLLAQLGVRHLRAVIGASIGGLMALDLAIRHPEIVDVVVPIAAGIEVTPLQAIHNFEQITAITNDPAFRAGNYYDGPAPERGLALARMIGHKTYVSLHAMEARARLEVSTSAGPVGRLATSPLESYMAHQGDTFVRRFDANTYLQIVRAWQAFDLGPQPLFGNCHRQQYLIFSIDSDVSFYPEEQDAMARALAAAGVPHRRITVHSDKGHDAFLLEPELFTPHLAAALNGGL